MFLCFPCLLKACPSSDATTLEDAVPAPSPDVHRTSVLAEDGRSDFAPKEKARLDGSSTAKVKAAVAGDQKRDQQTVRF